MYIFCICSLRIQSIDCFGVYKDLKLFLIAESVYFLFLWAKSKKDQIIEYCHCQHCHNFFQLR